MNELAISSALLFSEPSSIIIISKGFKLWSITDGIDLCKYSASLYVVIITLILLILINSHARCHY